jgi:hypothetical protein
MAEDHEKMRTSYHQEIISYKSAHQHKIKGENRKFLKIDDLINVSLFNSLEGIDPTTLKIVNDKISEIKEIS